MEDYDPENINVTLAQFFNNPDIPDDEREYYMNCYMLISKSMKTGNLKRWDMPWYKAKLRLIHNLFKLGLWDKAREEIMEVMQDIQCSGSFDGFQVLFGQHGIEHKEDIRKIISQQPEKARTLSWLRKKPVEQESISSSSRISDE